MAVSRELLERFPGCFQDVQDRRGKHKMGLSRKIIDWHREEKAEIGLDEITKNNKLTIVPNMSNEGQNTILRNGMPNLPSIPIEYLIEERL